MIDTETKHNPLNLIGQRIRLIYTDDAYTRLVPGELGTIDFIDDAGTFHIKWDSGSYLGLVPDIDVWEYV